MGKDKLKRFAENESFKCLFQPDFDDVFRKDYMLKGRWHSDVFKNDNPIVLELGCGRGEYTVEMGRKYPEINFIGIDIKGARLWRGAKSATEESLPNVAFVRCRIEFIEWLFGPGEVSEIWITFADPQINRDNKRLTGTLFLERYRKFLIPDGIIHLKTDSLYLHNYTVAMAKLNHLEITEENKDIYGSGRADELLSIKTHYEENYLSMGVAITYLTFKLSSYNKLIEPEKDSL
ncbi:MAG: tRNA (guanosine(46)-N7)-methyltransferase TrmB [Bacteroidetes bacterium GWF2_40_14]|nr:MAG: tRNA (guanosine(46)-N7)-methyltransferase TrmB [Bacteroidetes bacterium GWF2_40_14]